MRRTGPRGYRHAKDPTWTLTVVSLSLPNPGCRRDSRRGGGGTEWSQDFRNEPGFGSSPVRGVGTNPVVDVD